MPSCHHSYARFSNSDTIVVFVHGIQGSPRQFRNITSTIPKSIDYMCVLLPGHGCSLKSFRRNGRREWASYFSTLTIDLRKRYSRIYFVGHSMGCLIGIDAAVRGEIVFDGMLLVACPLRIRFNLRYLAMGLKAIKHQKPSNVYIRAMQDANSIDIHNPLGLLTCIKPYAGLIALMIRANRHVLNLNTSVCMIQSDADEIVSARSAKVAAKNKRIKTIVVSESSHFYYSSEALSVIQCELAALIQSN